ncbi:MAG: DNA polymerase I [Oscillospiraceae bacterium]|nr:DNA polymerase I [Oscillospiraceae bacterium]
MLIDGNSIVNRAFYGIRALNAPDGTPTNGIYGFVSILRKMLDDERPDGLCVAFDLPAPTFRHEKYAEYKAQRKPMPEELRVQMPILKQFLDACRIRRVELEGAEADDLLGTLSRRFAEQGHSCVICTGDRDSLQLVSPLVTVKHVKTRGGRTETINYTPEVFLEEYGFEPIHLIDLKALMGDASDNIPGVAGVGEKTAMALIQKYRSVERIYSELDTLDERPAVIKRLKAGHDMAKMSYELATIVTDEPVELTAEATRLAGEPAPELYTLCKRLGFEKFITQWGLTPPAETSEQTEQPGGGRCEAEILTSPAAARAAAAGMTEADVWYSAEQEAFAVLPTSGDGCAYVLRRADFASRENYAAAVGALLAPEVRKSGHNIKDIQRALLALGTECGGWEFDTALAAYLLDATAGDYEISRLTAKYCGFRPYEPSEGEGQMSLLGGVSDGEAAAELASRAAAVGALRPVLDAELKKLDMDKLYYEIELPLCEVLAEMEHTGFAADSAALEDYGAALARSAGELQSSVWALAGEEFNINSPKQLGEILFEKLQLPAGKKNQRGWSTSADVLERLRGRHPIVQQVLDYRALTKLKSTYADGLLRVIAEDGRIHTDFKMTVTATGRLSSAEPNLQNIPVRTELGAEIRKMFAAAPGMVLADADYSQIELRILAHISGDKDMQRAFLSGEDIHTVTASQVFGVPAEQVTPLQRRRAKAVNFGIVYGISAFSLAQDIGVTNAEAKAYMDAYLSTYHGVRDYMKRVVEQARETGYVATLFGRRRYLPELKSSNRNVRAFGERVALNMPVQGTAADIIKLAMVNVRRRLAAEGLKSRLILQVHDELIAECPEDEAEQTARILSEEMQSAVTLSVPLTAEAKLGRTWAEAH